MESTVRELPYRVERSSKITRCCFLDCKDIIIPKGTLIVKLTVPCLDPSCIKVKEYHPKCFFNSGVKNVVVGDFDNFHNLKWEDQSLMEKLIVDNNQKQATAIISDFKVEYASSNHGKCYNCDTKIKKLSVQVTRSCKNSLGSMLYSIHWNCFCESSEFDLFSEVNKISGFDLLKPEDQQTLIRSERIIKDGNWRIHEMSEQNDQLIAVINELKAVSFKDLLELLDYNNQFIPGSTDEVRLVLADRLIFGALNPCTECSGLMNFISGLGYQCTGNYSEWCKCQAVTVDPVRTLFIIPDEFKIKFKFFETFEPKVGKRIIKVSAPSSIANTEDLEDNNSLRPLRGMHFVIDKTSCKNWRVLEEEIIKLGGQIVDEVHENVAAVIANKSKLNFRKCSQVIEDAKKYNIQVVSDDFAREAKHFIDTPVSLIVNKNVSNWGDSPSGRIASTIVKSVKIEAFVNKGTEETKKYLKSLPVFEEFGVKYSVTLGNVEIRANVNDYYKIEILRANFYNFMLVQSWGRIGTTICGMNYQSFDKQECIKKFKAAFKFKTGNNWDLRNNFIKKPEMMYPIDTTHETIKDLTLNFENSDESIKRLLVFIFDIKIMEKILKDNGIDMTLLPLGMLSKFQMGSAFEILQELQDLIDKDSNKMKIIEASNKFHALIPQSFGLGSPTIIDTKQKIHSKWIMTESLAKVELAYSMAKDCTLDQHYLKLKTNIVTLKPYKEMYQVIAKCLKNTHGRTHQYSLEIEDIFEIYREGEEEAYKPFINFPNRRLLWHGSRSTNFASILSQGLRIAPPEAPSSGYMFGKGIYFADIVTKSANYCHMSLESPSGLLLLCEVALGDMYEKIDAEYILQLPIGKHSVWGKGLICPKSSDVYTCDDGVKVYYGRPCRQNVDNPKLNYNEFVVYDVNQVKIRYLIRVKYL